MKKILPYNPKLKILARKLRNNSTLSEVLLWNQIKNKKLAYKFQRQKIVDNYIIDFYCQELNLAIEVDGASHGNKEHKDKKRQDELERFGIKFLRFKDSDVKKHRSEVVAAIQIWIEEYEKHTLTANAATPLKRGFKK